MAKKSNQKSNKRSKKDLEAEKLLVERAKADAEAFGQLYDKYFDKIYTYVVFKVSNREVAEDVVSLVFEKAMRNIENFNWKGYSFGSWLYKIAHNLVIDIYKQKSSSLSLEDAKFTVDEETERLYDKTKRELDKDKLVKAIDKLSEDQKHIVYLRYIDQLTIQETVDVTGRTIDSVKSIAKRALQNLRKLMAE